MNPKTKVSAFPIHRRGFTLVELMIVVVIIVVLVAIGFPVARNMKANAERNQCISRLHSWGIAISGYAADHEGKVVWKNWAPIGWDPTKCSPYIAYWTAGSIDLAAQEDAGSHDIQKLMRHCPSMPLPKTSDSNPSVDYAMIRPSPAVANQSDYALASIKNPGRFMFMIEALENSGSPIQGSGDFATQVKPLTEAGPKLRHKHSVNTLFGDYSVRAMTWKEIEKGTTYWFVL